jgi:hypothetical protein
MTLHLHISELAYFSFFLERYTYCETLQVSSALAMLAIISSTGTRDMQKDGKRKIEGGGNIMQIGYDVVKDN